MDKVLIGLEHSLEAEGRRDVLRYSEQSKSLTDKHFSGSLFTLPRHHTRDA